MFSLSKYKKLKSGFLNKNNIEQHPFRSELFNIDQLGEYAKILAGNQPVGRETNNNYLRERLTENDARLQAYTSNVLSRQKKIYISPATEWLTDNFYLIEEHIQLARRHFPKSYSKELPALTEGPYKGLPRVYGMAVEYISHTDAQIDEQSLRVFFKSYQDISVLSLGELWALPIMLRLLLIENLRRIVDQLEQDRKDRELADTWMDKVEEVSSQKASALVEVVSDMAKSNIPLSGAFVAEFSKRLSSQNLSLKIVRNWLEQNLRDEGLSAEELIHLENQNQAAEQVSVSHSIKSLRFINSTDWKTFIESISVVEEILLKDPSHVYGKMDFESRDHYRHVIERLAQLSCSTEKEVARQAVLLAENACRQKAEKRFCHVGYYLTGEGLELLKQQTGVRKNVSLQAKNFLKKHTLFFYTGSILLLSLLATYGFSWLLHSYGLLFTEWKNLLLSFCFFIFISQTIVFLINWISTLLVTPDFLPRLDFAKGIPAEYRSIVVIPAIITGKDNLEKLISDLEIHYLSNRDENLHFALLTDFPDADNETEQYDAGITNYAIKAIRELNKKYCPDNENRFYLFHRPRLRNPEEKKWMGYERKRGKLMAFNAFLKNGSTRDFLLTEGNLSFLKGIKYVITLDADTHLTPYSAHNLIGTMAHILNRPVIDPQRNIVVKGYGILQPRVAINLRSSRYSLFSRAFTDEVGIDPYTRAVSDVYQDLFHEGSFVGKGIYDVNVFETVLANRFPENKILSHDLLESAYTRSGLAGDVEVYESYPASFNADAKRRHRWIRGDWQIIQWLFPQVPLSKGTQINPLSGLSKWKITDNLRRSLVPPLSMVLLLSSILFVPQHLGTLVFLLTAIAFLPFILAFTMNLFGKPKEEALHMHLKEVFHKAGHQLEQLLLSIVTFPYNAWICADAIFRSLWRMIFSHRNLLQWQTAEEAERTSSNSAGDFYKHMWFSPFFALLCFLLIRHTPSELVYLTPFLLLWLAAPLICWFISQPVAKKKAGADSGAIQISAQNRPQNLALL